VHQLHYQLIIDAFNASNASYESNASTTHLPLRRILSLLRAHELAVQARKAVIFVNRKKTRIYFFQKGS
jgi:hypothetical protein